MTLMPVDELKVVAEHANQMLFKPHHQGVNPAVENHIGAFPAHLRAESRRHILDVHWRTDHSARDA